LAAACVLVVAGVSHSAAQFPPPPGQSQSQPQSQTNPGSVFPPPPGQGQAAPPQSSAFPPPPAPGRASAPAGISIAPSGGFSAPQGGGFGAPASGGFAAPAPGGGFGGPPQGPSEAQRVCSGFPPIREEVEKSGNLIKAASARKASREEVCPLFKSFAVREGKMLTFLQANQKICGVPPQVISQLKTAHAKTIQIRNVVCSAGPAQNSGPTLSDALGGPIIADDTTANLPNRGTFDTLTGNALQR
jgi:hypothetical protein